MRVALSRKGRGHDNKHCPRDEASTQTVRIDVPSPLAGEGSMVVQKILMGEGYNAESEALRTGFRRKPDSIPMIADSR